MTCPVTHHLIRICSDIPTETEVCGGSLADAEPEGDIEAEVEQEGEVDGERVDVYQKLDDNQSDDGDGEMQEMPSFSGQTIQMPEPLSIPSLASMVGLDRNVTAL